MTSSQSAKDQKKAIKALIKATEQEYKNKVREAEKRCHDLREEAEKTLEREKAEAKAKKEKADKDAKDEYQKAKQDAAESQVQVILDLVKNAILDIQSKSPEQQQQQQQQGESSGVSISRSFTVGSSSGSVGVFINSPKKNAMGIVINTSSSPTSSDDQIKDWVEYAAEKLEHHMSKSLVRKRLMEEVAAEASIRQQQTEQETTERAQEIQRQIEELQLQLLQHSSRPNDQVTVVGATTVHNSSGGATEDIAPPSYVNAVGPVGVIGASDYSALKDKKN
ncbi:hypothetical protein BGX26_005818 [Mortierella sp. AD094]|nr:hypothetical protein BGX26_005818 [Mortierella sp. AD094]